MIFIAGAGGTVGRELVTRLSAAGAEIRCGYHSADYAAAARDRGIDAVAIDYGQPRALSTAFRGCDRLYLIGPNLIEQTQLELNAVEAALAAGVQVIVKQSVMGAAEDDFELARVHRPVERAIEASGLRWAFLRPSSFMQNVVTYMGETIRTEDAFYSASGAARISHVDVRDIAAVATKVLMEPGHDSHAYTLTGPEALSYDQLASELSIVLGRQISHISLSPSQMKVGLLAAGLSGAIAERMLDLDRYYKEDRASTITDDIRRVVGRDPGRLAHYLGECAAVLARRSADVMSREHTI